MFPNWTDYHKRICLELENALKYTQLEDHRINGAITSKYVPVKQPDDLQAPKMPYVALLLSGVSDLGWDETNSGQNDYQGHNTKRNGTNHIESANTYRETISFTIEVYSQTHFELLKISQAIKKYFGVFNSLSLPDFNTSVSTKLHSYLLQAQEADDKGNIKYYLATFNLDLQIISNLWEKDQVIKAIKNIQINLDGYLGSYPQ